MNSLRTERLGPTPRTVCVVDVGDCRLVTAHSRAVRGRRSRSTDGRGCRRRTRSAPSRRPAGPVRARRTLAAADGGSAATALDAPQQTAVAEVMDKFPRLIDTRKDRSRTTPFVFALALTRIAVVVTGENDNGSRDKPKIPTVCRHFGIRAIKPLDFIRENRWAVALRSESPRTGCTRRRSRAGLACPRVLLSDRHGRLDRKSCSLELR